ncbi:MAG: hypothetical protein ACLQOO_02685 [Terriglobia bacterium]
MRQTRNFIFHPWNQWLRRANFVTQLKKVEKVWHFATLAGLKKKTEVRSQKQEENCRLTVEKE